jgi:dGTPase
VPKNDSKDVPLDFLQSRERDLLVREANLAAWAFRESLSRGRQVAEDSDLFRTDVQRDRDRIVHSAAFRRLNGKTQVFVSDTGDHYRTRLTHSLEVAQVGRSIARTLRLHEGLVETLALAHDLGHPPFGHSGGDVLNELMADHGGFEHNHQSLRIVDRLETRYPGFHGLNLLYEVRESILKHSRPFVGPLYDAYEPNRAPLLEAQVVDLADGIAYLSADVDDGLRSGLLVEQELDANVRLWQVAREGALNRYPKIGGRLLRLKIIAELISLLVRDAIRSSADRMESERVRSLEDVRTAKETIISLSKPIMALEYELRGFLYDKFYTHYKVGRMRHRASVMISGLFRAYQSNAELMPPRFCELAKLDGLERTIADYISGMTDQYAQKEYGLLFHPGRGSLDP